MNSQGEHPHNSLKWLYDDEFLYNGKSVPQIYHIVAHNKEQIMKEMGANSGMTFLLEWLHYLIVSNTPSKRSRYYIRNHSIILDDVTDHHL